MTVQHNMLVMPRPESALDASKASINDVSRDLPGMSLVMSTGGGLTPALTAGQTLLPLPIQLPSLNTNHGSLHLRNQGLPSLATLHSNLNMGVAPSQRLPLGSTLPRSTSVSMNTLPQSHCFNHEKSLPSLTHVLSQIPSIPTLSYLPRPGSSQLHIQNTQPPHNIAQPNHASHYSSAIPIPQALDAHPPSSLSSTSSSSYLPTPFLSSSASICSNASSTAKDSITSSPPRNSAFESVSNILETSSPSTSINTSMASTSSSPSYPLTRKYKCKICNKGFTTSGHLARHHRIHTGVKNYACPYEGCNSRFSRQDNCMQHFKTHLKCKKSKKKPTK